MIASGYGRPDEVIGWPEMVGRGVENVTALLTVVACLALIAFIWRTIFRAMGDATAARTTALLNLLGCVESDGTVDPTKTRSRLRLTGLLGTVVFLIPCCFVAFGMTSRYVEVRWDGAGNDQKGGPAIIYGDLPPYMKGQNEVGEPS